MSARSVDRYCIVGAGPFGLIVARALLSQGIAFDLFERHDDVGGIWDPDNDGSPMYDSAHFISSKWMSGFYGYPMPDDYPDYPTNRQILAYIRGFAREYGLYEHITFSTAVEHAEPVGDQWLVRLAGGEQRAYRGLICAPGNNWYPNMPAYPGRGGFQGETRHSVTYRNAREFCGKRVLIVGCGNSGVDIACDAALNAERAFLSVRRGYRFVPKHIFGVPTDVYVHEGAKLPEGVSLPEDISKLLDAVVGDLTRFGLPAPDHAALSSHPIMNTQILHHLAHGDIAAKPDVARFTGRGVVFADGTEEELDLVLFATGYQWRIPYLDEDLFEWKGGRPQGLYLNVFHRTVPNLYVLGMFEIADAAFKRFDDIAQLVAGDIKTQHDGEHRERLAELKANHHPDLRGGMHYIDTPRHTNYVEVSAYLRAVDEVREDFGWTRPDENTYNALRRDNLPTPAKSEPRVPCA